MPITHSNATSQATPKMVMDEIHNNDAVSSDWKEGRNAEDAKSSLSDALEEAFSTAAQHNHSKDSLSEALDAIVEDSDNGNEQETKAESKDPVVDEDSPVSDDNENKAADKDAPSAHKLADEPDEDGLVYVSMTFKIDPTKYRSANYNPLPSISKDAAKIGKNKAKKSGLQDPSIAKESIAEAEESIADSVKKDDEPTPKEEEIAAEEADEKADDLLESKDNTKKVDREANDSALDDEVVSSQPKPSYPCALPECGYNGGKQDLSKTAMDVRPRPTRQTCQTTFAQCRAENPLFCRFHGPKLLEADIRGTMRALGIRGQVLVTKVPNTDNTFKVTVGCRPSDKEQAKSALRWYSEQMGVTGITNTSDINDIGANGGIGREFQMDLLRADRAPSRSGKEAVANLARNRAVEEGRTMPVVGEERPARQRRPRREQAAAQPEPQPRQEANREEQTQPTDQEPVNGQQQASSEQQTQQAEPQQQGQGEEIQSQPARQSEQEERPTEKQQDEQAAQPEQTADRTEGNRQEAQQPRHEQEATQGGSQEQAGQHQQPQPAARQHGNIHTCPTDEEKSAFVNSLSERIGAEYFDDASRIVESAMRGVTDIGTFGPSEVLGEIGLTDPVARYIQLAPIEQRRKDWEDNHPELFRDSRESRPTDSEIDEAVNEASRNWIGRGTPPREVVRERLLRVVDGALDESWGDIIGSLSPGNPVRMFLTRTNQEQRRRFSGSAGTDASASGGGGSESTPPQQPQTPPRQGQPQQGDDNSQQGQIEHYEGGVKARFSNSERQAIEREMGRAMRIASERPDDIEARSYAHTLSHLLGSRDSAVGRRNHALAGIRDNITKAELLEKAERRLQTTAGDADRYNGSLRAIQKIAELSGIDNLRVSGDRMRLSIGDGDGETRTMSIDEAFSRPLPNQGRRTEIRGEAQQSNGGGDSQPPQQADAQSNEPPRRPTDDEINSLADEISNTHNLPQDSIKGIIEGIVNGEINPRQYRQEIEMVPADNPVRRYIDGIRSVRHSRRDAAEVQHRETRESPPAREIENISSSDALSRVKPPVKEATMEEVQAKRLENENFWNGKTIIPRDVLKAVGEANTNGISKEVFDADHAVQMEAMPNCRTFRGGAAQPNEVLSSQTRNHGCNCWKTVAAALLRLRGFKVRARRMEEASPVFEGTKAESGAQQSTFVESQSQMQRHYERVNESTFDATQEHIRRIAEGSDGSDGNPPSLPYPDGTFVSAWNGNHCVGAMLYKGKFFMANPYFGPSLSASPLTHFSLATMMCISGGYEYKDKVLSAARRYFANKEEAAARGEKYQLPPNTMDKDLVFHFLNKRRELRRLNPDVTDGQVAEACGNDDVWRGLNGSFVIRPDEPLIPALFGLAKPSTT